MICATERAREGDGGGIGYRSARSIVARSRGGWRSTGDSADPRPAKTIRMSNDGITIGLGSREQRSDMLPRQVSDCIDGIAGKGDYNQPGPGLRYARDRSYAGRGGVLFSPGFEEFPDFRSVEIFFFGFFEPIRLIRVADRRSGFFLINFLRKL